MDRHCPPPGQYHQVNYLGWNNDNDNDNNNPSADWLHNHHPPPVHPPPPPLPAQLQVGELPCQNIKTTNAALEVAFVTEQPTEINNIKTPPTLHGASAVDQARVVLKDIDDTRQVAISNQYGTIGNYTDDNDYHVGCWL